MRNNFDNIRRSSHVENYACLECLSQILPEQIVRLLGIVSQAMLAATVG